MEGEETEVKKGRKITDPDGHTSETEVSTHACNDLNKLITECQNIAPGTEHMKAVAETIKQNTELVETFTGGRLKQFTDQWHQLISEPHILNTVKHGYKIQFCTTLFQPRVPSETRFSDQEAKIMTAELTKLLDKKVIVPSDHEPGEYISRVFLRENRDGSRRMILNLKSFNNSLEGQHFKMETF